MKTQTKLQIDRQNLKFDEERRFFVSDILEIVISNECRTHAMRRVQALCDYLRIRRTMVATSPAAIEISKTTR
ncbi:hypothetical protein OOZ54_13870 [Rhodopseudomonas palustris]|uniref:hypothetical protein n=1 Tax=Rhodopseudomonas palustris TaxID=1076 RepID=UPI0022F00E5A|nr:hypothetical protein [Rhodopseudomonas palustris]WBU27752.1 hypothetical protein OOZ54_13870 [Rhodopseudomonas palustris]